MRIITVKHFLVVVILILYEVICLAAEKHGYRSFTIDSWGTAHERAPVESWKDNPVVTRHSFSDDIRAAILDRDWFDVALLQNRFADAWRMGSNTEQGHLWRKMALDQAKKYLKQLVREPVFESNLDKMAQAQATSEQFSEPVTTELINFIEEESRNAQEVLRNLVLDAAARLTALRTIADKLFES